MKPVKDIIKEKRLEHGLTMKELAQKVGVSEGTISRWESGEIANMRRSAMVSLSKVLDISPETLMGWDSDAPATDGYYDDPDTAELAEKLRTDPELKVLFSAAQDLSPEEMQQAANYIKFLKTERDK